MGTNFVTRTACIDIKQWWSRNRLCRKKSIIHNEHTYNEIVPPTPHQK